MPLNNVVEFLEVTDVVRELEDGGEGSARNSCPVVAAETCKDTHRLLGEEGLVQHVKCESYRFRIVDHIIEEVVFADKRD